MINRSLRAEVRNPLLLLPAAKELAELPPDMKRLLRRLLLEIRAEARSRAEKCWVTHKAPMAVYWKVVAVFANHTSRLFRDV